ncbi:MAG: hypothetical protein ACI4QI_00405, partial [Candidatus Coproplasma sp.]
ASDIEVFAGTEVDNVQEFTQNSSDIPLGGMSGKIIRDRYNRTVFKQFVAPTSNHEAFPIITAHIPLVLHIPSVQMKDSHTYLSFFDTAGGLFKKGLYSEAEDCTMIYRSDCIILLLNAGENSTQNADGLGCAAANEILKTIIQRRPKKLKNMQDSVALAIVVNKFDKIAGEFDENSHVRCSPPFADENRFKDSARHDYINQCSEEVEEYIKKKDPEGGEALLKTIKDSPNGFVHHKFFAVSSVGRSDSILHPKDGETKMLFKSQSSHMEDVLLWLMYKTGIIL